MKRLRNLLRAVAVSAILLAFARAQLLVDLADSPGTTVAPRPAQPDLYYIRPSQKTEHLNYGGPHFLLSRMHLSNAHEAPTSGSQP
jgi:hypothetical protein